MRFGILDPDNWPSYDVYQLNYAHGVIDPDKKLRAELYFQCSIKPHLVLYNAHLQGQFRKQKYEYISYPKINHFVVEGFAGVGATIPNCKKNFTANVMVYVSGRTAEIKSPLSRTHSWGGVQILFTRIKPK